MRIVIDLQGAQSTGSRNRGIGRYSLSLSKAIIANKGEHEILLVLNGQFPEIIAPLQDEFKDLLSEKDIHTWNCFYSVYHSNEMRIEERRVCEKIREAFIASLNPDIVLITSLFEGSIDDAVTSIGCFNSSIVTASILYDLIPYIYPSPYLDIPDVKKWYEEKIEFLKKSDILLSISNSSRQEALKYLDFPEDKVFNISTASDSQFHKIDIDQVKEKNLRKKYGFDRSILMYTGGIDHRKNIDGLIRSFALLDTQLHKNYQLAIVCSIDSTNRERFSQLAIKEGLDESDVVLTGYVSEEDLITLYNISRAFIFPSWHEGFGLPALEAMQCGIPVIVANSSSLPEVVGLDEALFDPKDDIAMAKKIEQVLSDEAFRNRLIEHNKFQVEKFSWDISAKKAIKYMEKYCSQFEKNSIVNSQKYKLAYISPLPPERSGIADYSIDILSQLVKYYDIDVIVQQDEVSDECKHIGFDLKSAAWFKEHYHYYDRVVYQLGNSQLHEYMFELLKEIEGVVVLHDFFLSGIVAHLDMTGKKTNYWSDNLYHSHGYQSLKEYSQASDLVDIIWRYPANLKILKNALKVIVHSKHSLRLADKYYGDNFIKNWSVIPLLRVPSSDIKTRDIREKLDIPKDAFVICSFGFIDKTKLHHRILKAFMRSAIFDDKNCYLIFVGANEPGEYGDSLILDIESSSAQDRIKITGWVDTKLYQEYLSISDVAVQLRTLSRGETSAAVLDCMNYSLATIVNAHGSMADLSKDSVLMLEDDFTDKALIEAMQELYANRDYRKQLAKKAKEDIEKFHSPDVCAKKYVDTIEEVYNTSSCCISHKLIESLKDDEVQNLEEDEILELSQYLAQNFPPTIKKKQLFLDISSLVGVEIRNTSKNNIDKLLEKLVENQPSGFQVEPVYFHREMGRYYYARDFISSYLEYSLPSLVDEQIDAYAGDILWRLNISQQVDLIEEQYLSMLSNRQIKVSMTVEEMLVTVSEFELEDIDSIKQIVQSIDK